MPRARREEVASAQSATSSSTSSTSCTRGTASAPVRAHKFADDER